MRTIAASGIALVVMGSSALADGLPGYEPAVYSWSGLYFGVNGGYGWTDATSVYVNFSGSGAIAGGQIGFDWQIGKLVLGAEVDSQWSGQKADFMAVVCGPFVCAATPLTDSVDYFGTGRIRLGTAFNRTLVYATGGVAWTHVSMTMGAGIGSANGSGFGWTVGSGVELAVANNVRLKLEYLFIDTPVITLTLPGGVPSSSFEVRDSIARVGLNVRFPAN